MKTVRTGLFFLLIVSLIALVGCGGGGEAGTASQLPRFTDNADGTVTDNLNKLVWLRRADCFNYTTGTFDTWNEAMVHSNSLASGSCELTDGSIAGQWRLPTIVELESLLIKPLIPTVNPFRTSGNFKIYWSSTTDSLNTNSAWSVSTYFDTSISHNKIESLGVWPVRDIK